MQKIQLNTKSLARIAAVQTLYQYNNTQGDITSLLLRVADFYKDESALEDLEVEKDVKLKLKVSQNYLKELVNYTHNNLEEINSIISSLISDPEQIKAMPKLLLSVLQVAICELKFFPETPRNVVINEFTDIASDMLGSNEVGFVNSALDKFTPQLS